MSRKPRRPFNATVLAHSLAHQRHIWLSLIDFDPISRSRALISSSPDHDAWLLTWLPGQRSGWHDHADSSGSYLILQGALTELATTLTSGDQGPPALQTAALRTRDEQHSFGRRYVHNIANLGPDPAVSLHVYTPPLTVMTTYTERDGLLHAAAS